MEDSKLPNTIHPIPAFAEIMKSNDQQFEVDHRFIQWISLYQRLVFFMLFVQ
jgi:hypothetical protein